MYLAAAHSVCHVSSSASGCCKQRIQAWPDAQTERIATQAIGRAVALTAQVSTLPTAESEVKAVLLCGAADRQPSLIPVADVKALRSRLAARNERMMGDILPFSEE